MTTTENNTTYTTNEIKIGKTIFAVTTTVGKFNYINVRKVTANPFGTMGNRFENMDEAISHYKNPTMKVELLKIELGLN